MISVALQAKVEIANPGGGELVVDADDRGVRLTDLEGADTVLMALRDGPLSITALTAGASARRAAGAVRVLLRKRLVELRCVDDQGEAMRAQATSGLARPVAGAVDPAERYQLSRFVHLRRSADMMILESVRTLFRVTIDRPSVLGLLGALAKPGTPHEAAATAGVAPETAACWLEFLLAFGVVVPLGGGQALDEDLDPDLVHREFHDVLLHMYSRQGLTDQVTGAAFRYAGVIPPWPATREPYDGPVIALPVVDLDALAADDPCLIDVMESRKSFREFGERGLTLRELSTFLYRSARIREHYSAQEGVVYAYDTTSRPYPSGGGAYDLEIYLFVGDVAGLEAGFYHYDPHGHGLTLVSGDPALIEGAFTQARLSSRSTYTPQVVLTFSSRFARLSWKYQGISYATTLKNVGALVNTMYAVATAMRLAPCALGNGDDAGGFANATGLSHLVESPVGDFMLGTLPE
ncbi:SagB family peptide dehydrogenase [Nonomuraea glycinis]|uniref:SagB family peptide dehydrogenase n=1 Tax=Nonomuraea glycinis TaxID=2047744 RepID=UPI002E1578D0|nr:SagB family peptide dehydrogenase [Nonomuraea glycinis]